MASDLVLGLDLGTNSVGWALIRAPGGTPTGIVAMGVRIFPAGMEGSIQFGKEESRNRKRRMARQARRGIWRSRRRRAKIYSQLRDHGFLPSANPEDPDDIRLTIDQLDREFATKLAPRGDHRAHQVVPYLLRAKALRERLEPFELGRALYHLAQRRGFRSIRKEAREDEDLGQVKQGIADLEKEIAASGHPTLGAYFASLDPDQRRIRARWTARSMFEHEFEKLCEAQSPYHSELTAAFRDQLRSAFFYQRPLRSQKSLVGHCSLEPAQRRCAIALFPAQRFRLLQAVNHLEWWPKDGERRRLTTEERDKLIVALQERGDLTFTKARSMLGFKRASGIFNLEAGGEKRLAGNRTHAKLRSLFDETWDSFSQQDRERIVHDMLSIQRPDVLARRGRLAWHLPDDRAETFGDLLLEQGYASHSRKAIRALLPYLEEGLTYTEARMRAYPDSTSASKVYGRLPPTEECFGDLRNPAVTRTLSELRRVVNSILREYGKPSRMRIELARDLKQSRRVRRDRSKRSRHQENVRSEAKRRILEELGYTNPSRRDIEKVLLAEECGWRCPYTDRSISFDSLLGTTPQFDIEHILPFSRTLDNSFANKTVCYHEENRTRKRNRTPYEAYAADSEEYERILGRVRAFSGDAWMRRQKINRFERRELTGGAGEEFSNRQLNDTRYASLRAADYLGLLYGGRVDSQGTQRVDTSAGGATAILRRNWGLEGLLGGDAGKGRGVDHRHHAIDALIVAMTGHTQVQSIARAAEQASRAQTGRLYEGLVAPWEALRLDVKHVVGSIVCSHRMRRSLSGPLHEKTLYGRPRANKSPPGRPQVVHHIRKPVSKLSARDIAAIVDSAVRSAVEHRLSDLGCTTSDAARAFELPAQHPYLLATDGRRIPIHRVRIGKILKAKEIGYGPRRRHVAPGSNHHMAIVSADAGHGKERWEGHVVTLLDALERLRTGSKVVEREWGDSRRLVFTLASGDCIARIGPNDELEVMHVKSVSEGVVEALAVNDARPATEVRKAGAAGGRSRASPERLRKQGFRKVIVNPLGGLRWARD